MGTLRLYASTTQSKRCRLHLTSCVRTKVVAERLSSGHKCIFCDINSYNHRPHHPHWQPPYETPPEEDPCEKTMALDAATTRQQLYTGQEKFQNIRSVFGWYRTNPTRSEVSQGEEEVLFHSHTRKEDNITLST